MDANVMAEAMRETARPDAGIALPRWRASL